MTETVLFDAEVHSDWCERKTETEEKALEWCPPIRFCFLGSFFSVETTCVLFWFRHRKYDFIGLSLGFFIHIHDETAYAWQVLIQSERLGYTASVPRALLYIEETAIVVAS